MNFISFITILLTTAFLHMETAPKTYHIKSIASDLTISGKADSPLWKDAVVLTDFTYPWNKDVVPATTFRAVHSKDWLYLQYIVKDDNVHVYVNKKDKTDALNSDRVEIFMRPDEKMVPYYGLEMDPGGRVYDFRAEYLQNTPKVNGEWSWPAGKLIIKTTFTPDGYILEAAINKATLNELGLIKNKKMQAGLYRGNCVSLVGDKAEFKWIAWVKPTTPTPQFHTPSSFGLLVFED